MAKPFGGDKKFEKACGRGRDMRKFPELMMTEVAIEYPAQNFRRRRSGRSVIPQNFLQERLEGGRRRRTSEGQVEW